MARRVRIFREALISLSRDRKRVVLMMLGIGIGVAALTVVICVGRGTRDHVLELVARHGLDTLMIRPGSGRPTPAQGIDRSIVSLKEEDAHAIASEVENVLAVAPVQNQGGLEIKYKSQSDTTMIFGVTPAWAAVRQFGASRGSFINQEDMALSSRVCLIGQTVAAGLLGDTDPIGKALRIGSASFTIKGVLIRKGASVGGSDRDNRIVIPLTTATKRLFARTNLDQIMVQVRDVRTMHETADEIRGLLRERHRLKPSAENDFRIREPEELIERASGTSKILMVLLLAIAVVGALVGGVVILNIMLMSVSERSAEIGIRRAVGARERDIVLQFGVESLLVSAAGGLAGCFLGFAVAQALPRLTSIHSKITWEPFAAAVLICGLVALVFGVYPAREAGRTDPIRALRS